MTLKSHIDKIEPEDNVVIGLGDSFTQGVGAYSEETWKYIADKNPGLYNISGQHFIDEQGKNNWVKQLCKHFMPDYKCMSLGVNGAGNRAAVKELYLNPLPKNVGNVIVILMATGLERFDFLKKDKLTSGEENHQKWATIWPSLDSKRDNIAKLEKIYARQIWEEHVDVMEFMLTVAEASTFCRAHGYRFFFGSAFDDKINQTYFKKTLGEDYISFSHLIDWKQFLKPDRCTSYMEYIRKLENNANLQDFHTSSEYMQKRKAPLKYITPCNHWTVKGSYNVAKQVKLNLDNKI